MDFLGIHRLHFHVPRIPVAPLARGSDSSNPFFEPQGIGAELRYHKEFGAEPLGASRPRPFIKAPMASCSELQPRRASQKPNEPMGSGSQSGTVRSSREGRSSGARAARGARGAIAQETRLWDKLSGSVALPPKQGAPLAPAAVQMRLDAEMRISKGSYTTREMDFIIVFRSAYE